MAVTLKNKTPSIAPRGIIHKAGPRPGDDDECTPAQRRAILADAKAGLKEIQQGEGYGPFATGAELRTFVERAVSEKEAQKPRRKVKQS